MALTQSVDFPQLLAEVVYPTKNKSDVPEMLTLLQSGLELRLQRTHDLSAILQIGHALDGRMQVTLIPLLYGTYALKNGFGTFALEPPELLNVGAGFPLVRGEEVRSVLRESARRRAAANANNQVQEPPGEIVRLEGALTEAPAPGETPPPAKLAGASAAAAAPPPHLAPGSEEPPLPLSVPKAEVVATPPKQETAKTDSSKLPKPGQTPPSTSAKPSPPQTTVAAATVPTTAGTSSTLASNSVPTGGLPPTKGQKTAAPPAGSPPQTAVPPPQLAAAAAPAPPKPGAKPATAVPVLAPPKALAQEAPKPPEKTLEKTQPVVPPKPFIAAAPAPSTTQPTGSWKMLSPGKQTQGRSVTTEQATALRGRNDNAPLYLHGKFVVTAAGGNRAVLRTNSNSPTASKARVIVEYPAGGVPPQQGSSIAREDGRGFEIREVRPSPDGQINIYVREITSQ